MWHQRLVCGNEFLSARMLGPPKDSFGLAFFYNFTAFHHNNPVSNLEFDKRGRYQKLIREAGEYFVEDIFEEDEKTLWLGTVNGLMKVDLLDYKYTKYENRISRFEGVEFDMRTNSRLTTYPQKVVVGHQRIGSHI
ncbi:MAG: hypothetical protein AAF370_08335, partial [Pseudomonadota bacterium]